MAAMTSGVWRLGGWRTHEHVVVQQREGAEAPAHQQHVLLVQRLLRDLQPAWHPRHTQHQAGTKLTRGLIPDCLLALHKDRSVVCVTPLRKATLRSNVQPA